MNWFFNLKLSKKLIIVFLLLIILSLFVGYQGYNGVSKVMEAQDLSYKMLLTQEMLSQLDAEVFKSRILARDIYLDQDQIRNSERKNQMNKIFEDGDKLFEEVNKNLDNPEAKELFSSLQIDWNNYKEAINKLILMIESGSNEEAFDIIIHSKASEKIREKLMNILKVQAQKASELNIKADEDADATLKFIITLLIIFTVVSSLVAYFFSKDITTKIKQLLNASEKISKGETDFELIAKAKDEFGQLFDKFNIMIANIKKQTEIAEKISQGNLNEKAVIRSDKDTLSKSLNQVIENLTLVLDESNLLVKSALDGKLSYRANQTKAQGAFKDLIKGLNDVMDSVVTPLNLSAEYIDRISKGDLPPKITEEAKGDFNEIKNNLNQLIDYLKYFETSIIDVYNQHKAGEIEFWIDTNKFRGIYKSMAESVNNLGQYHVYAILDMLEIIKQYAEGDFSKQLRRFPGKQAIANERVDLIRENLLNVSSQLNKIIEATLKGELEVRVDSSKLKGEYKNIVDGLNKTMEAISAPLSIVSEKIQEISVGNIPDKINENEFSGDYKVIITSLNMLIDSLSKLINEMKLMHIKQVEGDIDFLMKPEEFSGVFQEVANGVNEAVNLHIQNILMILGILGKYADGDFSQVLKKLPGKQIIANQIMDKLRANLINLVDEAVNLTKQAALGNFNARGNAEKLQGGFRDIVAGVNQTLDVVVEKTFWYEQLLDAIPFPISVTDMNMAWTFINKPVENLLKLKREEVIGKQCNNWGAGICKTDNCGIERLRKNNPQTFFEQFGSQFQVDTSYILNKKGERIGHIEVVQDVTKIKQMENYLKESTQKMLVEMEKFANGDLTVSLKVENKDEIGQLYEGFNKAIENVRKLLIGVNEAVHAVASASNQISASSEEMAAGAQEQSSQTSEVASSVEEMTKTILETSKNASYAAETAKKAGEVAKEGGKVVQETIQGMDKISEVVQRSARTVQELGKSSDQIGEIVQVIDDIADQTNLLALNAAIEAARAGEQGRGFAVVADEVRKLAERTTKATKEIAQMIKQIQKDTQGAVESMEEGTKEVNRGKELAEKSGKSLNEIIEAAIRVVDTITQVAAASEEQSSAAEEISKSIESINTVTQETAGGIQQIARASEDLNRLTQNLQELISRFNIGDKKLLSEDFAHHSTMTVRSKMR